MVKGARRSSVSKDGFQSEALSRKEKRKLKKEIAKKEEEVVADEEDEEEEDDDEDDEDEDNELDLEKLEQGADSESESESESEVEEEEDNEEQKDEQNEDDEEDDVALSEVEVDSDADIVPYTKLTINNLAALKDSLARIQLPWSKHSFEEHQSVTSTEKIEPQVKDIYDDTQREVAFYKQGLEAAITGRKELLKLKIAFSRPLDYFAEMIKSDEHMEKLKQKLVKEAIAKKATEDSKKQRHLKKFGKQVQNATLQERQKEKRETLEKIKSLKKKRQGNEISNDDFDIAIEEATAAKEEYKDKHDKNGRGKPNNKRLAKNAKYGSGGMKRFKRKNDAASSADISGFSSKKMKTSSGGKKPRPGKSKRRHV
ncbi:hypothetical protein PACTADRAFT_3342 [Pachysolen tannophilus NRRL Y-2460]|uniref:rRNA-processing protein EBP2 n=1 Tax=Pachysolen tannophilus NRRL Y-2460 TaxID=669874 RepID=A0A1E4TV59_PACTA|nr:hypothetical protein PACTADRAFT_3342 [Pachysolen tannophilus NRRL Y-2460]